LIGSVIAVSWLDLLPSGSGLFRWLVIVLAEAFVFLWAVNLQEAKLPQDANRNEE